MKIRWHDDEFHITIEGIGDFQVVDEMYDDEFIQALALPVGDIIQIRSRKYHAHFVLHDPTTKQHVGLKVYRPGGD